jgi:diguanylate cyclase (GGDEF)-like protein
MPLLSRFVLNQIDSPALRGRVDTALGLASPSAEPNRIRLWITETPSSEIALRTADRTANESPLTLPADTPAETLRQIVALMLERSRLRQKLRAERRRQRHWHRQARCDALTGLPNRRSWQRKMAALVASGTEFCLVLLDIDGFKAINDFQGHPAGDAILLETGKRLRAGLRETDLPARIGGDEFAAVLVGLTSDHAGVVVERLRQRCLQKDVTLSAGYACWSRESNETPEQIYERADAVLFTAKQMGRNQSRGEC